MTVCFELGKTEDEVKDWKFSDIIRWTAYFRLRNKAEKKAIEKARKEAKNKVSR